MWIHITLLGILQTVLGLSLIILSLMAWFAWTWFRHGTSEDQRTTGDWIFHLAMVATTLAVDAAYVWWVFL